MLTKCRGFISTNKHVRCAAMGDAGVDKLLVAITTIGFLSLALIFIFRGCISDVSWDGAPRWVRVLRYAAIPSVG